MTSVPTSSISLQEIVRRFVTRASTQFCYCFLFFFGPRIIAPLERTVPRRRAVDQVDRPQRMNVMDYASKIISSTSTAAECQGRRDRRPPYPARQQRRRQQQPLSTQKQATGRAWAACRGRRPPPPPPGSGTGCRVPQMNSRLPHFPDARRGETWTRPATTTTTTWQPAPATRPARSGAPRGRTAPRPAPERPATRPKWDRMPPWRWIGRKRRRRSALPLWGRWRCWCASSGGT